MTRIAFLPFVFLAMGSMVKSEETNTCKDAICPIADDVNMLQTHAAVMKHHHSEEGIAKVDTKEMQPVAIHLPLHPKDQRNGHMALIEISSKKTNGSEFHPPNPYKLTGKDVSEIEKILTEAKKVAGDAEAGKVEKEIEETAAEGGDVDKLVVGRGKDHEEVMKAIEEVEVNEDVEETLKKTGGLVDSNLLNKVNGLPDTPEQTGTNSEEEKAGTVVEGDELADSKEAALVLLQANNTGKRFVSNLWDNPMSIPYCFAKDIAPSSKKAFQDGVQHFLDHIPCMGFKEVAVGSESKETCSEQPGIFVKSNENGCYAHVGQPYKYWDGKYSPSVCHLQPNGCDTLGIAAHEIGHNIGMLHEQSRTDHRKYVKALLENVKPAQKHNYEESSDADTTVPYDVMSLMHYGDDFFALPGKKTIKFVGDAGAKKPMGNRQGLTSADAKQVAKMYGCEDQLKSFKVCTEKIDSYTEGACMCHKGSGFIKAAYKKGFHCVKKCSPPPYGYPNCGCPVGCTKSCFESDGKEYCNCKDCVPSPAPAPSPGTKKTTTKPPPTEPPTTTTTTTGAPKSDCADKYPSFCLQYVDYCSPHSTINGDPIYDVCPVTCCQGCAKNLPSCSKSKCKDEYKHTCEMYGSQYCPSTAPNSGDFCDWVRIGETLYKDACEKTCGYC